MGDVYRLIASGVETLVIIDGIFHTAPSVWQREILEAMDAGVRVVGAASIGALRAAELDTLGMVGVGTVYGLYRDGVIDADDEVALLHGDEASGYRHISEPLVNIRHALAEASRCGILSGGEEESLLLRAKATFYHERSYESLLRAPEALALGPRTLARLRQHLLTKGLDLKAQDAVLALQYAARLADEPRPRRRPVERGSISFCWAPASGDFARQSCHERGFLLAGGELLRGEAVLEAALADAALAAKLRPALARRHFLALAFAELGVEHSRDWAIEYMMLWKERFVRAAPLPAWLAANGITGEELALETDHRAKIAWMGAHPSAAPPEVAQRHKRLGEEWKASVAEERPDLAPSVPVPGREEGDSAAAGLLEIAYLATWAAHVGIRCPAEEGAPAPRGELSGALRLARWLDENEPPYLGYTSWRFELSFMRELQVTGLAALYAAKAGGALQ